jgi:hypothetical protein
MRFAHGFCAAINNLFIAYHPEADHSWMHGQRIANILGEKWVNFDTVRSHPKPFALHGAMAEILAPPWF